jgi:hypothetical protein
MTSIFDITDWAHVASFFVWTLAVCALAKAIFASFPAAELQYRLALRDTRAASGSISSTGRSPTARGGTKMSPAARNTPPPSRSPNPSSTPAGLSSGACRVRPYPGGRCTTSSVAGLVRPFGRPC